MIKEIKVSNGVESCLKNIPASAFFGMAETEIGPRNQVKYFFHKEKLRQLNKKDPLGTDPFSYPERYNALIGLEEANGGTAHDLIRKEFKRISMLERNRDITKTGVYHSIENYKLEHGMIRVFLWTRKLCLRDAKSDSAQKEAQNEKEAKKKEVKRLKWIIGKLEGNIFTKETPEIERKITQLNIAAKFFSKEIEGAEKLPIQ